MQLQKCQAGMTNAEQSCKNIYSHKSKDMMVGNKSIIAIIHFSKFSLSN